MFFVGTLSTFAGTNSVVPTRLKHMEKLGHSAGRAKRYLNEHKSFQNEDGLYRPVVFVLHNSFRLQNDIIRQTMKMFKCDWQHAKFHIYRMSALDVIGNPQDWKELVPQEQSTADPKAELLSETAVDTNQPVEQEVASIK